MSEPRQAIAAGVRRAVMVEAGHRCAIPTCRGTSALEVHHILEHSKGGPDTEENLIVLCAVCHARVTKGEIDTKSVRQYKANLGLLNSRYGDFERRVLQHFADTRTGDIALTFHHEIHLRNLLRDGLLVLAHRERHIMSGAFQDGIEIYALTDTGKDFVDRWVEAAPLI